MLGITVIFICRLALFDQTDAKPAEWEGTWLLNLPESKFGPSLMPGLPADFVILSQSLKLDKTAKTIRLTGDTTFRDGSGIHSSHENNSLELDGKDTVIGPVSLSFRPVDDSAFEIVSRLKTDGSFGEVSRFSVSSNGMRLTETKTQTKRGAVDRVATQVLVFVRQPQH